MTLVVSVIRSVISGVQNYQSDGWIMTVCSAGKWAELAPIIRIPGCRMHKIYIETRYS